MTVDYFVSEGAEIGEHCSFGHNAVVEDGARIGNSVIVGHGAVVFAGTRIGDNVSIGSNAIVGKQPQAGSSSTRKTKAVGAISVGFGTVIGVSSVLYAGSDIDVDCYIGDQANIRENCRLEERALIGRAVLVESDVRIGMRARVQTGAYITGETLIEDDVFIGPMVVTTNDRYITMWKEPAFQGPCVKRAAAIGAGACLLSGITVGEEALVGMGSVVISDVPPRRIYVGIPARDVGEVRSE